MGKPWADMGSFMGIPATKNKYEALPKFTEI